MYAVDIHGFTPCMVAIANEQKDILKIMLDSDLNILDTTRQESPFINIVEWAIENDHMTLLQVCVAIRYYIKNLVVVVDVEFNVCG